MSIKTILVFCVQALFVQSALSQCTSRAAVVADPRPFAPTAFAASTLPAPYGLAAPALAATYGLAAPCGLTAPALDFTPTNGGGLPVSSASVNAPIGISVASENIYEGALAVVGELPFVGTVGWEGVLPTAGAGVVNHACGNGINAMVSDATAYTSAVAPAAILAAVPAIAPAAAIAPLAAPAYGYNTGCGYSIY